MGHHGSGHMFLFFDVSAVSGHAVLFLRVHQSKYRNTMTRIPLEECAAALERDLSPCRICLPVVHHV